MSLRRFVPYARYLRSARLVLAGSLACALVYGISSGFGVPFMVKTIFPRVFDFTDARISPWELVLYVLWLPVTFIIRGLAGYFNAYLINLCGVRVLEQLRMDYFSKLQRLPLAFFQRNKSGDLLSRGLNDTNLLQTTLTSVSNEMLKQPTTLLGALGYLVFLSFENDDVVFLLLCVAIIPVLIFPVRYVGRKLIRKSGQLQEELGAVTSRVGENLGALKEIRAFGLETREAELFRATIHRLFRAQMKVVKYAQALSPTIEFIVACGIAIALLYAHEARIPLEVFMSLFGALHFSYDPIKKIGVLAGEIKRGEGALNRIEAVLAEPESIADPVDPVAVNRLQGGIRFEHVGFAYPDAPAPVLHDVSVTIPAGTVCALVGPSGAGKSTFASLVPRFYDATDGGVLIDGIDIRRMRVADLRRNIALVSQDPVLFNDTIRNNILVGRPEASHAEVEEAARSAFAHDFIESFQRGYDTIVGERGASLSGGQRQRVALARAFLRGAPILILDEATSALDAESEAMIQRALARLVEGRTVIVIAHRFSTIRNASLILVFNEGRIVATGNHESLHRESELYRTLYERQR